MPAKSTIFCNYIVRLHVDEAELGRYKKHPDERIHLAGLTSKQGMALKNKSVTEIEAALREEQGLPPSMNPDKNHVVLTHLVEQL